MPKRATQVILSEIVPWLNPSGGRTLGWNIDLCERGLLPKVSLAINQREEKTEPYGPPSSL